MKCNSHFVKSKPEKMQVPAGAYPAQTEMEMEGQLVAMAHLPSPSPSLPQAKLTSLPQEKLTATLSKLSILLFSHPHPLIPLWVPNHAVSSSFKMKS